MKLHLMSDLHLEYYTDHGASLLSALRARDLSQIDAVVLAGDITSAKNMGTWMQDMQSFLDIYTKVLYIPGNHEFYGSNGPQLMDILRAQATMLGERFTLLDYQSRPLEFKGHRFLGGTMWFKPTAADWRYSRYINDFNLIDGIVPWAHDENTKFTHYLQDNLRANDIVVTHHLPHGKSTPAQFVGDPTNRYFVCDMESILRFHKPALWLHGHTHEPCDYTLDSTRVVCNPRGYPNEFGRRMYGPMEVEL